MILEKKRILQVIGGLNRGGAETMIMNIYRNFDLERYSFVFLVFYDEFSEQDYESELMQKGEKIIKLGSNNKGIFYFIRKLYKVMKHGNYDAVHIHTLFNSGIVAMVASFAKIQTIITHSHSTSQMKKENVVMKLYMCISRKLINKFSTNFIACSPDSGYYLFGKKEFLLQGKVIKNAIDINVFNTFKQKKVLPDEYDHFLKIGCVGSFYKVKNHDFLINIAEIIVKEHNFKDFIFFLVGKGELEDDLRNKIISKHLGENFCFLGTRTDVNLLMKEFDLLVMPSLYEGIPVTLIEAQASDLNCIISSNIDKTVDIGLELLDFISLDKIDQWIRKIVNFKKTKNQHSQIDISKKLLENGYDLNENVKVLEELYNGNIQ